jgi:hypothetical protein
VKVVKDTHKIVYDDDEYEKLICEAHLSSKGNQPFDDPGKNEGPDCIGMHSLQYIATAKLSPQQSLSWSS